MTIQRSLRIARCVGLAVLLASTMSAADKGSAADPVSVIAVDAFAVGRFGTIHLYRPNGDARQVVIFISGDGGWNEGVVGMAEQLRSHGALVAGIDIRDYFRGINASREKCAYLGAEFERLSRLVQQRAGLSGYHYPILVGYSSGATLVYALLNQTPRGIFAGGLSLGFCPDLELAKPLCKGERLAARPRAKGPGVDLLAADRMYDPWIALQGVQDQVCDASSTQAFVSRIEGAKVVMLPRVGHGYGVLKNWSPQFLAAYEELGRAPQATRPPSAPELGNLPVVEVAAKAPEHDVFVLLITGDGGYAGMDQQIASAFAAQGRPVVALNSLKYFWTARTPGQLASDVDRLIRHYESRWRKSKVILVGYSQGADVMPFILNRLPSATRASIASAALIGISDDAVFQFHIANWLTDPAGTPTMPELERLRGVALTCIYGADEKDSVCPRLPAGQARVVRLPGGHHFNGDYAAVARTVLAGAIPPPLPEQ